MANGTETPTAPYLPWPSFTGFARDLKGSVVPPRIDRSIMKHMSGGGQSALRTALRFFDLVTGEDHKVTQAFRDLVASHGTDDWKTTLTRLVASYDPILADIDIKTATPQIVEEAFRARGNVEGSALKKAIRFYVAVAEEAGVELSPLLSGRRKGSKGPGESTARRSGSRARRTGKNTGEGDGDSTATKPPEGTREIRFPLPDRDVRMWLPSDVTDQELAFVWKYLKDYLKLKQTKPV